VSIQQLPAPNWILHTTRRHSNGASLTSLTTSIE
jgi:hypothetical protein